MDTTTSGTTTSTTDPDLQKLIDSITKKLDEHKGRWNDLPADLRERMLNILRTAKIAYRAANDPDCTGDVRGRVSNSEIYICPGENEAVLLHEVVHAAGGEELDAEAVENHLYVFQDTDPDGSDFQKFLGQDMPCSYKEKKTLLLVSRFVIWNPKNGEMWFQTGTRKAPKKGRKVNETFVLPESDFRALEKNPPGECAKEQAKKCGAPCKDFDQYGYCDRKVYQPPCYQHRSAV